MLRFPLPFVTMIFAVALVAASHSSLGDCGSDGWPAAGIVEITAGDAGLTFYIDDRSYAAGNGIWPYLEGNGIWTSQGVGVFAGGVTDHNLQRGTGSASLGRDEICTDTGDVEPDVLLL